ncbi:glycosyltransferase family 4 protein [Riemerella anatipestifer]|uniref:glycosyltransferase family 4 protein n=1 Tax=Riemerella anatipestifer TaxID=34085 RepID=UPI0021D5E90A|nr:glycosyltransferase family 4 protein [Riemerella anatipestifer]MCU7543228.1 glycosyltransferase family 4 protein [Riemerella anatipestifer]MCW0514002.1 glycosyltransferase family 4 protein [Riemerella anatipestifer]
MNIVYFFPNLKDAAGTERMLNVKANYLADVLGYNVTIITYRQYDDPIFFKFSEKIKMIHFDIPDPTRDLKNFPSVERKKLYKNFMATYRKKVEDYLYHNPTDIAISMYFGAEHKFLPLIKDGSKKILEYHFHFDITPFSKILKSDWSLQNLKAKILTKLFQRTLNKFDKIVVLTEEDEKEWSYYFDNVTNIPNPITIEPITADTNAEKVLAVGRHTSQKGFDYLVEAWAIVAKKFPNWQLDIYGHGEQEEERKQQIKNLGLEKSINLYPPSKEINKVFSEHSIFVLSSRFEGFPLVLIEALASGLAPVSFEYKNGPKQMLGDNKLKEFLVEPNNVEIFAEKLSELMESDVLRKEMSEEALRVSKRYEMSSIMKKWEGLFRDLVKK